MVKKILIALSIVNFSARASAQEVDRWSLANIVERLGKAAAEIERHDREFFASVDACADSLLTERAEIHHMLHAARLSLAASDARAFIVTMVATESRIDRLSIEGFDASIERGMYNRLLEKAVGRYSVEAGPRDTTSLEKRPR